MNVFVEKTRLGDVVKQEAQGRYSREAVWVLAGAGAPRVLEIGAVGGRVTKGAPVTTPAAGNTGDGAAGAVTLGPDAQVGDYTLTCTTAAEGGGVFQVQTPGGPLLPPLTVGEAYQGNHINLTLAAGAADFVAGDKLAINVPPGSGKVKAFDPAAVDGSQVAACVMLTRVTAPDGVDAQAVALVREAVIAPSKLAWAEGITTGQKNAALAQLAALGIITRQEA